MLGASKGRCGSPHNIGFPVDEIDPLITQLFDPIPQSIGVKKGSNNNRKIESDKESKSKFPILFTAL